MKTSVPTRSYQSPLGEPVDIQRLDIPSVSSPQEFAAGLARVIDSSLAGFIVRKAAWEDVPEGNDGLAEFILTALDKMDGPRFIRDVQIPDVTIQATQGIGRLHLDNYRDMSVETLNGHTTIEGSGAVTLAESGPQTVRLMRRGHLSTIYAREITEQFGGGKVYPQVMSPIVHTGHLSAGDHIVFPLSNQRGPMWHRFDTDSPTRSADAWFLDREA